MKEQDSPYRPFISSPCGMGILVTEDKIQYDLMFGSLFGSLPKMSSDFVVSVAKLLVKAQEMTDVTGSVNLFRDGKENALIVPSLPMNRCDGLSITQCQRCKWSAVISLG